MLINYKRTLFILISITLYYSDLVTDILFFIYSQDQDPDSGFVIILLIQPFIYLLYYYLSLLIPVLCHDQTNSLSICLLSALLRAPLYVILCELKLMLTPLYFLVSQDFKTSDRIKQNFVSHLLVHSILQSLPMTIYQFYKTSFIPNAKSILWASPCVSSLTFCFSFFLLHIIKKMNSGGLNWIQNPKATLQFYSLKSDLVPGNDSFV